MTCHSITPETVRVEWGVPVSWAANYPQWPESVRQWLREVRAAGLTQIVVTPRQHGVDLSALRPGEKWEEWA